MSQEKLQQANQLIKNKKYDQAYSLLSTMGDNPTASNWLKKLEDMGYGTKDDLSYLDNELHQIRKSSHTFGDYPSNDRSRNIQVDDANEHDNDYAMVKFIASLYKFFGVFLIGVGLSIGGYQMLREGFWTGLLEILLPCLVSGTALLFSSEAIMMFHEMVMNSRKQLSLLRTIAQKLK